MSATRPHGHRVRTVIAIILGLILTALMVHPWARHTATPIIAGVISAPLFFWILWTIASIALVWWICYRWDPSAAMVPRAEAAQAARLAAQASDPATEGHQPEGER